MESKYHLHAYMCVCAFNASQLEYNEFKPAKQIKTINEDNVCQPALIIETLDQACKEQSYMAAKTKQDRKDEGVLRKMEYLVINTGIIRIFIL